jgi:hypothetical protein
MAKQSRRGSYLDVSGDSLQGFQTITTSTTLTVASAKQGYVSSPAAAVTVTLPTTDVKAGFRYRLDVIGATETNFVGLNSSGGNEIDRIGGRGSIEVIALQDAPTTAAHWRINDLYEETGSISLSSTGANTNAAPTVFLRRNKFVMATIAQPQMSAAGGVVISLSAIPTRFRPASDRVCASWIQNNTNVGSGVYSITAAGIINSYLYNVASFSLQCAVTATLNYQL